MSRWRFGEASLQALETVDVRLVILAEESLATSPWDFMAREGRRDRDAQERYFRAGLSGVRWPHSAHNAEPPELARAIHFLPYPLDWERLTDFYRLAGHILQVAGRLEVLVRWGGGWKQPHDPGHYELVDALPVVGGE